MSNAAGPDNRERRSAPLRTMLAELKRRRVFQVGAVYAGVAFIILQAASLIFPALLLPDWGFRLLVIFVILGFPLALVLAWAFELTPDGVRRTEPGERYGSADPSPHDVQVSEGMPVPERGLRADPVKKRWRRPLGFALAVLAIATLAIFGARLRRDAGLAAAVDPASPTIVVLPFAPAAADSALERLGRDLVVTLTAGLDGMGELRTVDALTTLAQVQPGDALSLDEAHTLARRLGAERLIHGALTRAETGLRLDASLYHTGTAEPIARASVTAENVPALSDAATIALLDQLWQVEAPRVPSLAAVTKSAVPAARRAYLAGELALSRSDMTAAIDAFERAFAADTTFWWAYWRSMYPRSYRETAPADTALVRKVVEHRAELPEPDRLLVEASWIVRSRAERLARLRQLTERFAQYEPAWWEYANQLVHYGGYHGHTAEDARAALERVLALNPRFVAAWDHLMWVAIVQGDTAAAARAGRAAAELSGDGATDEANMGRHFRPWVARAGSFHADSLGRIVEMILAMPPAWADDASSGGVADGAPVAQIQLNRAMRERAPTPALAAALWRGEALAWAARGAWDSTLVAADGWARASGSAGGALGAYRLAVAGVMQGALPATAALGRRPNPRTVARLTVHERAELTWLDGVVAYAEQDLRGIEAARRALAGESSVFAPLLERSLAALAIDAAGDRDRAAREMVELEAEITDHGSPSQIGHFLPLFATTNRLLAARWLRSLGDDAEAARLLNWHEAILGGPLLQAWNRSIGGVSLVERAEIAENSGDTSRALLDFTRFLRQYDLADPAMRPLIERAVAGVERLGSDRRR